MQASSKLKLWSLERHPEPKAFKVEELRAVGYAGSSTCLAVDWGEEKASRQLSAVEETSRGSVKLFKRNKNTS